MSRKPVTKAIMPIAGLGTRFLPATKAVPKEMLTLVDRPLIQHAVEEARAAGIEDFVFVTSRGKTALEDHFDCRPELEKNLYDAGKKHLLSELLATNFDSGRVSYVRQNVPLGLAHAIWCARGMVNKEPFAVLLPDDVFLGGPAIQELQEAWVDSDKSALFGAVNVERSQIGAYGCMSLGEKSSNGIYDVEGIVEKPKPEEAPSTIASVGRYIFDPGLFEQIEKEMKNNPNEEVQLVDAATARWSPKEIGAIEVNSKRYDCGSKIGFLKATLSFGLARDEFKDELLAEMKALLKKME